MKKQLFSHPRLNLAVASFALVAALSSGLIFEGTHARAADGGTNTSYGNVTVIGDTSISAGTGTGGDGSQVQPNPQQGDDNPKVAGASGGSGGSGLPPAPTVNPTPTGKKVTDKNSNVSGFNGISHADQRNAGTGIYVNTQFSLEPPDQGLCAGNGFVVEGVNNGIAVYSENGKLVAGVEALSQFYKLTPEINRVTGIRGEFVSDPKCIYDSGHWFFTELEESTNPTTGASIAPTHTLIAVSQTSNPTGNWTIFSIDTTDDGSNGTPAHANCPCLGDQPLIGTDRYGFYITTNEFGQKTGFNGAQVYAFSKKKLIDAAKHTAGGAVAFAHIDASQALAPYGGLSYSIQPANTPANALNFADIPNQYRFHGIEYFLSALQFGNPGYEVLDNRIAVWALTNTEDLDKNSAAPKIALHLKVIGSETYGQPNNANQKPGPTPYRDALAAANPTITYNLEQIQTNDDRMNQVTFAQDGLWGAVNTIIGDGTTTGIAYFDVKPSWTRSGDLNATMGKQGYVSVDGNNVIFPSIAFNTFGVGAMVFTLVGPDYYPSSAYIRMNTWQGASGTVHIAAAGAGPDDGFTGYPPNGTAARWGDYSAAVASSDGSIWTANEYIPATPARTLLANWGTYINHLNYWEQDDEN